MLKLKLQSFGHLTWRADLLEKTWMLGKIEDKRKRGQQRMRWLDSVIDSVDLNLSILGNREDRGAWHATVHGLTKNGTQVSHWTTTTPFQGRIQENQEEGASHLGVQMWKNIAPFLFKIIAFRSRMTCVHLPWADQRYQILSYHSPGCFSFFPYFYYLSILVLS